MPKPPSLKETVRLLEIKQHLQKLESEAPLNVRAMRNALQYGSENWNLEKSAIKATIIFEINCARPFVSQKHKQPNSFVGSFGELGYQ